MEVLNDKEFQLIAKCQDFIKRFHTNVSDSDGNDIDYDDVCEKVKERNLRTFDTDRRAFSLMTIFKYIPFHVRNTNQPNKDSPRIPNVRYL